MECNGIRGLGYGPRHPPGFRYAASGLLRHPGYLMPADLYGIWDTPSGVYHFRMCHEEPSMGAQELLEQALKLTPDERFALADQVLHSLDRPDPDIDRVWQEEAERRLAAYRAGKVEGIPAEVIFGEIK